MNQKNLNIDKEYIIKLSSLEEIINVVIILHNNDIFWLGPTLNPFSNFTQKKQIETIKTWNFVDPSYIEVYYMKDIENNFFYWVYNFINENYKERKNITEISAIQLIRNEKLKKLLKNK